MAMSWEFRRGDREQMSLTHVDHDDNTFALRITENSVTREQVFMDRSALIDAHIAFERAATAAGWTLVYCGAERRAGPDRRHAIRPAPDRRFRIVGGRDLLKS